MTVLQIKELTNKRVLIECESFAFVLYKGELSSYGIKEGNPIKEECLNEILKEVLPKRACLRAMNLLKVKPYTEKELRKKLADGYYPKEIEDYAVSYVKSFGYINDYDFASLYIDTYKNRKSKKQMEYELYKKGISKEDLVRAFEDLSDEYEDESEAIVSFLKKKGFYSREFSYEEKYKLMASLCRKGFSPDMVAKVINLT